MTRLGRAHPQNTYHHIEGPVQSNILNISSSDFFSGVETSNIAATFSSQDSGSGLDLFNLIVLSNESGTFFDTSAITISTSSNDSVSGSDSSNTLLFSDNQCFSVESSSISASFSSSDSTSAVESQIILLSNNEICSSVDTNVSILESSLDNFSGADTQSLIVDVTSQEVAIGVDQGSLGTLVSSSDNISAIDNGSVVYSIFSSDSGSGIDIGNISNSIVSIDTGIFIETFNINISSSDSANGIDNPGSSFVSSDTVQGIDGGEKVSAAVASSDIMKSQENSISTIGTNLTLLWNVNMKVSYKIFSYGKHFSRSGN